VILRDSATPPPVAVIVTLYACRSALFFVETLNNAVLDPPAVSMTVEGLMENVGKCFAVELTAIESATLPVKPFRLVRVIVVLPTLPFVTYRKPGKLAIVNVGLGATV